MIYWRNLLINLILRKRQFKLLLHQAIAQSKEPCTFPVDLIFFTVWTQSRSHLSFFIFLSYSVGVSTLDNYFELLLFIQSVFMAHSNASSSKQLQSCISPGFIVLKSCSIQELWGSRPSCAPNHNRHRGQCHWLQGWEGPSTGPVKAGPIPNLIASSIT